jgi:transposase
MSAYSLDLRHKILSAWQNKENTQRGLAKRFKVSLSFGEHVTFAKSEKKEGK